MTSYFPPPVDRLLRLGREPVLRPRWPDYLALGLEPRHVPALIRMATDPALYAAADRDPARWAPIHAWRALAELGEAEAAEPLAALLEREIARDWVFTEVPVALGMLGAAALGPLTFLLFDEGRADDVRVAAARGIGEVAYEDPSRRDEVVAVLLKQLEDWPHQPRTLNGALADTLAALEAKEAAPVLEAAFAAGAVDEAVGGTWAQAQVDLGLVEPPDEDAWAGDAGSGPARPPSTNAAEKARKRRKDEKRARKKNRKK